MRKYGVQALVVHQMAVTDVESENINAIQGDLNKAPPRKREILNEYIYTSV